MSKHCDPSFARRCGKRDRLTELIGTKGYVAPEVRAGSYSAKADLWSLGVTGHFALSARLPEARRPIEQLVGNHAAGFLHVLLLGEKSRPTAEAALLHRFLRKRGGKRASRPPPVVQPPHGRNGGRRRGRNWR